MDYTVTVPRPSRINIIRSWLSARLRSWADAVEPEPVGVLTKEIHVGLTEGGTYYYRRVE